MSRELAVVVDCGSTNISVSVIDAHGDVVTMKIWGKACECCMLRLGEEFL